MECGAPAPLLRSPLNLQTRRASMDRASARPSLQSDTRSLSPPNQKVSHPERSEGSQKSASSRSPRRGSPNIQKSVIPTEASRRFFFAFAPACPEPRRANAPVYPELRRACVVEESLFDLSDNDSFFRQTTSRFEHKPFNLNSQPFAAPIQPLPEFLSLRTTKSATLPS
jgi:hypothetical protein